MGRLRYAMIVSLDGYAHDASGSFEWAAPGLDLHAWVNERERDLRTQVMGRRMWEVMRWWDETPLSEFTEPVLREFAELWAECDKVVVSRTLQSVDTPRTTLWHDLDLGRLSDLVLESPHDVSIAGPTLAGHALRAGLVEEVTAYVVPHLAGGGLRWLPEGFSGGLTLREHRAFDDGAVALTYAVASA